MHTKGPWTTDSDGYGRITLYGNRGERRLATLECASEDRHLIIAAPALLEACQKAVSLLADEPRRVHPTVLATHEAIEAVRTRLQRAIAQAEGKE